MLSGNKPGGTRRWLKRGKWYARDAATSQAVTTQNPTSVTAPAIIIAITEQGVRRQKKDDTICLVVATP